MILKSDLVVRWVDPPIYIIMSYNKIKKSENSYGNQANNDATWPNPYIKA